MTTTDRAQHDKLANAIRGLAMDGVEKAKSGHPGLPMGAADVATVLFTRVMKYDAADPRWPDLLRRGEVKGVVTRNPEGDLLPMPKGLQSPEEVFSLRFKIVSP